MYIPIFRAKMIVSALAWFGLLAILTLPAVGQASGSSTPIEFFNENRLPTIAGRIDSIAQGYYARGEFSGSILVTQEGQALYEAQFGWANQAKETPNSATSRHRLGSIGKQFTAAAILILMQDGKLKVEDTLAKHLPKFDWKPAKQVTLEQLLRHTSGTPRSVLDYVRGGIKKRHTLAELMRGLEKAKLEFEPDERWQYSNAGYTMLAAVVEEVSGQSYNDFLRERIFEPVGLIETHFDFPEEAIEEDSIGYYTSRSGKLRVANKISMSFGIGAGTFRTTPRDMVRWDEALRSGKVLSESTCALMYSKTPVSGNYAFGWEVIAYDRPDGLGEGLRSMHGGAIDGYASLLIRLMDDGFVIALLSNQANVPCGELGEEIQKVLESSGLSGTDRVQLALREKGPEAAAMICTELENNAKGRLASDAQIVGIADAHSSKTYGNCWFPASSESSDVIDLEYGESILPIRIDIHGTVEQGGLTALWFREASDKQWSRVAFSDPTIKRKRSGLGVNRYEIEWEQTVSAVRLKVDSSIVVGSNVLDAVALVSGDGTEYWATEATASSDRSDDALRFVPGGPTGTRLLERCQYLLDGGLRDDALELARFNASREVNSWQVQLCLARSLRAVQLSAEAIDEYEWALELMPEDETDRQAVEAELEALRSTAE